MGIHEAQSSRKGSGRSFQVRQAMKMPRHPFLCVSPPKVMAEGEEGCEERREDEGGECQQNQVLLQRGSDIAPRPEKKGKGGNQQGVVQEDRHMSKTGAPRQPCQNRYPDVNSAEAPGKWRRRFRRSVPVVQTEPERSEKKRGLARRPQPQAISRRSGLSAPAHRFRGKVREQAWFFEG
jgi:hypothetical protein